MLDKIQITLCFKKHCGKCLMKKAEIIGIFQEVTNALCPDHFTVLD